MPNKYASGVAAALFKVSIPFLVCSYNKSGSKTQVFMKLGLCQVLTSDQGTEFNNQINKELMNLLDIDYRLTTPYHPQVNNRLERTLITLSHCIG